jgi:hypothetical protein
LLARMAVAHGRVAATDAAALSGAPHGATGARTA